jgi:hypothetical protein
MKNIDATIICECGNKTIKEAEEIFALADPALPYKKAKKLVTGCNKTCCISPLMELFKMTREGNIDYKKIAFLIERQNRWFTSNTPLEIKSAEFTPLQSIANIGE